MKVMFINSDGSVLDDNPNIFLVAVITVIAELEQYEKVSEDDIFLINARNENARSGRMQVKEIEDMVEL